MARLGEEWRRRMSIIGWLFSALWQGFLGCFGISDAQRLGRLEVKSADQEAQLKEKINEAQVFAAPPRPESAVDDELRRHARD
jgi:hypothetical protein